MLKYAYWHIIIYFVPNLFPKILLLYKLICIFAFKYCRGVVNGTATA